MSMIIVSPCASDEKYRQLGNSGSAYLKGISVDDRQFKPLALTRLVVQRSRSVAKPAPLVWEKVSLQRDDG